MNKTARMLQPVELRPSVSQRLAIARALLPRARAEARRRHRLGRRSPFSAAALDVVAAHVGWSRITLTKALAVAAAARADRRTFGCLLKEMEHNGRVDPAYKKLLATRTAALARG